jgi:hypothetical protein
VNVGRRRTLLQIAPGEPGIEESSQNKAQRQWDQKTHGAGYEAILIVVIQFHH